MINIIKVELFRLKKSKITWVMLGLTVASPLLMALLSIIANGLFAGSLENLGIALRSVDLTTQLLGDTSALLGDSSMWALIATAVVLSKEFVDGTMRNVILANKSRAELYFGYLITSLIVACAYLFAYLFTTLAIVAPIFGFSNLNAGQAITAVLCSLALGLIAIAFVQSCMCMFMFGVRKQWATILLPILVCLFAPSIFEIIVQIIAFAMLHVGQPISEEALRFVPFINLEFLDLTNIDGAVAGMHILYCAVFTAVFVVSGYYTFKKSDLK